MLVLTFKYHSTSAEKHNNVELNYTSDLKIGLYLQSCKYRLLIVLLHLLQDAKVKEMLI